MKALQFELHKFETPVVRMRTVAILAADGVDEMAVLVMQRALDAAGTNSRIVAPRNGMLAGAGGAEVKVDYCLLTTSSALFDAVYIPGGLQSIATLKHDVHALRFIKEAYKYCKTVVATGEGCELTDASCAQAKPDYADKKETVITLVKNPAARKTARHFINAITQHRHWGWPMHAHASA